MIFLRSHGKAVLEVRVEPVGQRCTTPFCRGGEEGDFIVQKKKKGTDLPVGWHLSACALLISSQWFVLAQQAAIPLCPSFHDPWLIKE